MAKNKQIKDVLIRAKTEGAEGTIKSLNSIDQAIQEVNKSNETLVNNSRGVAKALGTMDGSVSNIVKGYDRLVKSTKSVNTALSGNVKNTKNIESYALNIEFLQSVMQDLTNTANMSQTAVDGLNKTMSTGVFAQVTNSMDTLVGLLQELVEGMDDLNTGTRISNKRLKQARDYIADVGQASDLTSEQMEELARAQRDVAAASDRQTGATNRNNTALRGFTGRGSSATRGMSKMLFGMNPLTSAYAALAVNIYAASEAFRVLNEAASFDRLQDQIATFSAGVSGINVRDLAADLEEASGYALTFKEAINLSTQGTAFNFTSGQMKKLTELTRKASIALGRDFAESMDRVTKGIAKQEIEVLDEIGVVTRLDTAFNNYGATIGKTSDQLTEHERQLALTAEVMTQLEAKYGGVVNTATEWERLSANIRNATQSGLSFTQQFLTPAVSYFNRILEQATRIPRAVRDITRALDDQKKTFEVANGAGNFAQAIASSGGLANKLEELRGREKELTSEIQKKNEELESSNVLYRSIQKNLGALQQGSPVTKGLLVNFLDDSEVVAIAKAEEELKIVREGLADGTENYRKQVEILAKEANVELGDITEATGQKIKAFSDALVGATRNVNKIASSNEKAYGSFAPLMTEITKMVVGTDELKLTSEASAKAFVDVSEKLKLDPSISSVKQLSAALLVANNRVKSLSSDMAMYNASLDSTATGSRAASLSKEIQLLERIKSDNDKLGSAVSEQDKQAIKDKLELLNIRLENQRADDRIVSANRSINEQYSISVMWASFREEAQSELVQLEIESLELKILALDKEERNTAELRSQLKLLKEKKLVESKKEQDSYLNASYDRDSKDNAVAASLATQNERTQVVFAQKELDIQRAKADVLQEGLNKERALYDLKLAQEELDRRKAAATPRDAQSAFSQLQGLDGLSDLQNGGLEIGETLSAAFADAADAGKEGFSGMVEYLSGNAEAFTDLSMGLANTAGAMYQSLTDARIAGIDQEIEAEKKRDGKSAESLAKIKKLEAKKIQEQAKASKAQVIMSTSVAIMRAFQDFGVFGAVPAAIMAGFGAMQIGQINSAANGQLAALNSGDSSGMSITGGERSNQVDVSSSAQSGEAGFFGGLTNNLPGRAGGGDADAGDALIVGETGAEMFIPDVPGSIVPAGRSNGVGQGNSYNFTIQATDSKSFEDQIDSIASHIYDKIESEQRARHNSSLGNIG